MMLYVYDFAAAVKLMIYMNDAATDLTWKSSHALPVRYTGFRDTRKVFNSLASEL